MKKRLVIIGLALALLLAGLMPAPVFAAAPEQSKISHSDAFQANGTAMVVGAGTITDYKTIGKNVIVIKKVGEEIGGQITSTYDWPAFNGTQFLIVANDTTQLNTQSGKFISEAAGTVTVFKNGSPCMTGKYSAIMTGDFSLSGSNIVFTSVNDKGLIELKGIPGSTSDDDAKGIVSATFTPMQVQPGVWTLGGNITIHGVN